MKYLIEVMKYFGWRNFQFITSNKYYHDVYGAGNGNDQNFQRGVFSARGGGYFGFSTQGGYIPPWKNRKFGF